VIGFAALSIVGFWALKTRETYLRNFCIVYILYTLVLVVSVLKKYLALNVENFSEWWDYIISGINYILNFAVLVAAIHFFLEIYQVRSRKVITTAFLVMMVVCVSLILSPFGANLDVDRHAIEFGIGYQITSIWYFASFTLILALGYGLLGRIWKTDRKSFVVGLLIFATVGYIETLFGFIFIPRSPAVILSGQSDFLFSSIPYALYGIFLVYYFLNYSAAAAPIADQLSESFMARYGITDREHEIIQWVIQGKSNAEIASQLFISLSTVKTHLHNIYKKIGVDSRYDLLARIRSDR
jgi:DNA-binding CsgD family transcriptional regulator